MYESQGRYYEAEPLYQQALQIGVKTLGAYHPDVAVRFNNLAGLYTTLERYTEAEPLYLQALQVFQARLETEHPYTEGSFNGLVNLIIQAHQASRANELSDHPITQAILQQIQAQGTERSDESATG